MNPVIALELLSDGTWRGTGILGPEAFDAVLARAAAKSTAMAARKDPARWRWPGLLWPLFTKD